MNANTQSDTNDTAPITLEPPKVAPTEGASMGQSEFVLDHPAAVRSVKTTQVEGAVPLRHDELPQLEGKAKTFLEDLLEADIHSTSFSARVAAIRNLASDEIRASSNVSNKLLEKPLQAIKKGGTTEGEKVASGLLDLRQTMEALDPARSQGGLRGLLSSLPFVNKIRNYFHRYEDAQAHINEILKTLYSGKDELLKDNAAIEQERANLWEIMHRLQQYAYMLQQLDVQAAAHIERLKPIEMERSAALEADALFAIRQKHQDLLTQLAVSVQGYLALGLIKHNNIELIKGVDRASTTTIAALRTAVIVAQALADQKIVLDQIDALNASTSSLIESTSEMLKQQTAHTYKQATETAVDLKTLEKAFANVFETMNAIDAFKSEALVSMKQTAEGLQVQIEKAQDYIEQSSSANAGALVKDADVSAAEMLELP